MTRHRYADEQVSAGAVAEREGAVVGDAARSLHLDPGNGRLAGGARGLGDVTASHVERELDGVVSRPRAARGCVVTVRGRGLAFDPMALEPPASSSAIQTPAAS